MNQDWIGVLDCNNFFVSCERLFRPDLKGKPVIVLSSNDGCIVARSQEVKDMNVPMGVPYFQVKDILRSSKTTCFSSNFTLYRDLSRRVFEVMKNELDSVEEYSIDEAFFQIKAASKLEATDVACKLKDKVELLVGIPVSIGIATSKTLAKYANGLAKKSDGVAVVTLDEWASRAPEVPLSAIWGVGLKTAHHFRNHNLHTVQDYLKTDVSRVAKLFGVNGQRLLRELQGVPSTLSAERIPQKSIVSSRSFAHSSTELSVIKDALSFHVSEIGKDLRVMRQKTKYIRIFIFPSRHGDFVLQGASAERVLEVPTNDSLSLLKVAHELLQTIYKNDVPYQKAGVAVTGFVPENLEQLGLFSEAAPVNAGALMQVVDTLNQSFGKETVTLGSSLRGISWRAKTELRSPSYTTKWTELQTVQS